MLIPGPGTEWALGKHSPEGTELVCGSPGFLSSPHPNHPRLEGLLAPALSACWLSAPFQAFPHPPGLGPFCSLFRLRPRLSCVGRGSSESQVPVCAEHAGMPQGWALQRTRTQLLFHVAKQDSTGQPQVLKLEFLTGT